MSTGFVLNIPQEMINRLDLADQKIEKLAKTSEDSRNRIIAAFQQVNTQGIDAFIQRLDVAQQKLAALGGTQINMGVNANTSGLQQLIDAINNLSQASKTNITINGLGTVGNQTQTAIDAINKLMATLQQLQQMGGQQFLGGVNNLGRQTLREMNKEARKMQKTMQDLDDAIQKYGISATDLANKLQQARQAQQQFNDAAKQQAQADVSGLIGMKGQQTTLNELKNYANELKRTMANLDPKSQEWKKLNDIYKQTNREIKNIQNSMKDVQKQSRSLMDISGQLARKLALVFSVSQITGYVKKLIEVRGEFELQQRSLQAILQNKDEANKIWQQTVDLAVRSPFRVKELVSYTKQLAAYRIESDKLFETNKMLADISAGLGVDMQRLILAFGQVRSAAYLRGTELRQFTEAGIPILEQLAQYFTELEGRAVSVGDVFERVSKRMVSFADVEEIFKRMTSEGGTFYRMQEIQAETLQGQISNLKDSVDIMLNDIGKAHEDTLRSSVSFVRSVVQNWRLLATAIQQAGFALAGFSAVKIIRALRLTGDALVEATVKTKGLTAATAKLKLSMMDLGKWVKANPYLLVAGLIASAAHALVQYGKSVDAMNEKYDEMSQRELRRVDTLKELNEQAAKNNQAIKDAIAEQDNASEGTDEYATAEENLSRARGKNISLLERLKKEYPEVYASITKQEDGTVDLTKAIEGQNKVAQRQIALQQQAKGGWFQESLTKNYEDAVEALGNYQSSLDKVAMATYEMRQNLSMALSSEQITQEEYDAISSIADRMMDIKDSVKGFNLIEEIFGTKAMSNAEISALVEPIRHALVELGETVPEYNWALGDFFDNLENLKSLPVTINEMVALDPEKGKENAGDYVESVLDEFGIVNDTIREWAKRKIEKIIGFKLVWGDGEGDGGGELTEDWAKRVDAAIKDINDKVKRDSKNISDADLFPRPKAGQTKEAYLALAKEVIGIAEMTYNETQQIEDESMVNRTKALSPYADEVKKILNLFKDNNKDKDDAAIKILNKRIGLIKEMYSEYQKGEKVIGEAAEKQVSDAYAKTFKEAFEDAGINLTGLVVDKEKLTELQNAGNEAGEVFSEAMLAKMNEVAEAGTYIRNISDKAKDQIKLDEGFVGYIYDDAEKSEVKTQIKTLEELYKYFDKVTGKAKEVEGQGTLTIGYGHALQTLDEAKKYLGITLEQADAEELLTKDIKDRVAPLNTLLDKYNELIVTQEQYDTLFNNFYQGGLSQALRMAFSDSTSELEGYIKGLDEDLSSWGSSFAQEWGDNWLEEFKQLETKAERFAKVLEIASVTTVASGSHIDKDLFYGENAMKARSARRAAEFRGDLEIVKLLEKAAVDVSQIDFTNIEGVVAILERLKPIAEKEGEEAVNTLNQVISKFTAEIGFTAKKNADKELLAQVQQLFDRYDLSLELKKLNIPPDLAKSLFDVDYLDLEGLKKAVEDQKDAFVGKDMLDEYDDLMKKIGELSRKRQEEEAKEFINFLKKNLNEIQIIQDKGAYNIALADKLFGQGKITAEQYMSSIRQIVEDTNKEVAKVNLDKFKDSTTYIKAMGNLAAYSRDELEGMINALQGQVGANAGNMGADEIRAYYEALERLVDQYDKIESPFQKGEINDLIEYLGLQKQLNQEKEKEVALEQRKFELNARLEGLQAKLASQQASGDTEGAKLTQGLIKSAVNELKEVDGELVSVTSNISVISEKVANLGDGMIKSLVVAQKVVNEIANIANASTKMFDDIKSAADALGADTESGGWAKAGYAMEMVGGVSSELTSGLASLASGDFAGALASVVGMVTKLISGFAKIHDQDYQDIIEAQAKEVERLGKAYEKLEQSTEKAYSIEQLQKANAELERNVELQIASYKAMIAAENAKKNTDTEQIEAWNEELEALTQQWKELKQSLVEGVGGVTDYRSQTREFVDSWASAFKETGDGLSGLKENFREFFDNIIAEQASLRVTEKFLAPFYESLSTALDDLKLSVGESKDLREEADRIMPELSKALELIWNELGGSRGEVGGAGLSGLTKGIQGITEDQADILAAYWNSVRGYTASIDSKMDLVLANLGAGAEDNPMLEQMRLVAKNTSAINTLLNSLVKGGHPQGGQGLKVFMD